MKLDIKPAEYAEVACYLEDANRFSTGGGATGPRDAAEGSMLFKVCRQDTGAIVGGYALRINKHQLRNVAWIMAAGGRLSRADLTRSVLPAIVEQARAAGATQLALATRRPGLIEKMQRLGFMATGVVMRANLC